jgi:hypothetical protein
MEWHELGSRNTLRVSLAEITGIDEYKLDNFYHDNYSNSVAIKMSWAAHRQTSRSEDMAYCFVGLFKVNMPLLNGEGASNAFRRLQRRSLGHQMTRRFLFGVFLV